MMTRTRPPHQPPRSRSVGAAMALLAALLLMLLLYPSACQDSAEPAAQARRVSSRGDLIGGPGALGEVGDYLLENDQIRVVIQDKGFSRGFGVYGGSLIDADLVRAVPEGDDDVGGRGRDQFGELFPAFFLQALVPDTVEILNDGSDGGPAQVQVSGTGGDFLTLAKTINIAAMNSQEFDAANLFDPDKQIGKPNLRYETVYELEPGARYVRIRTRLRNITDAELLLPNPDIFNALGPIIGIPPGTQIDIPLGSVVLFGAGNRIFMPGVGYDVRFSIEDAYQAELNFPALPGVLTNTLVSTSSNGVSYGFFFEGERPDGSQPNFIKNRLNADGTNAYQAAYPDAQIEDDTMLVPFVASSFMGVFYTQAPPTLAPGEAFEYTTYFVVGDGDAGSVMDTVQSVRGVSTATLAGVVRDELTGAPVEGAQVLIYDPSTDAPINQYVTGADGRFTGTMPPGDYAYRVRRSPVLADAKPFRLGRDGIFLDLQAQSPGFITTQVRDASGVPLPAKVTVVGTSDPAFAGQPARDYLFDLNAGESYRPSDFIADNPNDPRTLQYIEASGYTEAEGTVTLAVEPGKVYTVYASRGIEYDLQSVTVRVAAGQVVPVSTTLTRVVDTTGYVGADFHLHAAPSLDSDLDLTERVVSCAGEGLEFAVSTDHNFVTDLDPFIDRASLRPWINSMVGLELTTLESGHFNGFPVDRKISEVTRGSFEWSQRTPDEVFDKLRALGAYGPENTIVQVNHARDSILGYFSQFELDPLTAEPYQPPPGPVFDIGVLLSPSGPTFYQFRDSQGEPCYPSPYKDEDGDGERDEEDCVLEAKENTFSFNFDAMEIFNGKRFEQIHHFRMPNDITGVTLGQNTDPSDLPPAGTVLCNGAGELAAAGMVDDWFNLLNTGRRIAGMGNSDSHETEGEEPAYPRTYVGVGVDVPAEVTDLAVVDAIKGNRLMITNGPFVEMFVNDAPIGSDVTATDGAVRVRVRIQTAPWIDATSMTIYGNGELLETVPVTLEPKGGRLEFETTRSFTVDKDTWFVVEVTGQKSMFPVVPPLEVPPLLLQDAIGSLASAFGFGETPLGELLPSLTNIVTPFAITNPVWVDVNGGGFDAPGVTPLECKGAAFAPTPIPQDDGKTAAAPTADDVAKGARGAKLGAPERADVATAPGAGDVKRPVAPPKLRPSLWFPRAKGDMRDLRIIFEQFGAHSHAH